jgi:nitroreductase
MSSKYNFKELMKERHSARDFLQKEIHEETVKEIINIALNSPSWCNSQPWYVYVVSGKLLEKKKKNGYLKMNKK